MVARAIWRKKLLILGLTFLVGAAAFAAVSYLTPRYKSEARVLVEGRENIFLRPEAEKTAIDRTPVDQETVTSQVQLVLSRDLAREVIRDLKLTEVPEFNAALRKASPLAFLRKLGVIRDPMSMKEDERVLAAYYERLSAYAVDKSRVIAIEFQSADPELAARIANTIADKYLIFQQLAKQDQARSASKWLVGELDKLRQKVTEAEAKVEDFRAKSNLFVGSNNTSLSNQQLTELSSQVSAARAQKADAEVRARMIREALRSGASLESTDVGNSDLIRRLSEQRVTLRGQLAEQSSTLLPQHPRIKEMRAQIADLDQQIRAEAEKIARGLENEAKVAGGRLDSLTANLDQLKRQTASNSDQDVQLRSLEREAKAQRDLFESYLAKYREATARDSIAAAPADARVISRAAVSNIPYFPRKIPIVLIASLATLCLATAFVVTGALLNSENYSRASASVEHTTSAALPMAVAPRLPRTSDWPALGSPIDNVAAELREAGHLGKRVTIVGSASNVGTTSTAIALGRALARNHRVVLIELALHSPNIDVISADPSAPGLADLVRGTASIGDIITRDRASRLHLVAAGRVGSDVAGLVQAPMLWTAVDALAQSYDHLVVDAGAQPEWALAPIAVQAPYAVLVGGAGADAQALEAFAADLRAVGFARVAVMEGAPPVVDPSAVPSAA
ncbi:MAG: lipopolysaccharide biosynthesis protein [Rhizobiales bacterium]|nr:lipopolysaccharide biosynthesis protein [Hyphomicrobiales bacterium]